MEVIKDDGEPAKPGERGKIVVTNLANYVMPLIRYDTGDIGIAGHSCSCDRGFPIVKTIEGRVAEFIFKRSGEPIALPGHFLILGNFIKYINAFQFIQNTFEEVTILVVPNKSYNGEINNKLTKYFENLLGSKVTVMEVEDILAEKSGKKLLVKSKLKLL